MISPLYEELERVGLIELGVWVHRVEPVRTPSGVVVKLRFWLVTGDLLDVFASSGAGTPSILKAGLRESASTGTTTLRTVRRKHVPPIRGIATWSPRRTWSKATSRGRSLTPSKPTADSSWTSWLEDRRPSHESSRRQAERMAARPFREVAGTRSGAAAQYGGCPKGDPPPGG